MSVRSVVLDRPIVVVAIASLSVVAAALIGIGGAPVAKASVADFCTSVGATQVSGTDDCLASFTVVGSTTWSLPAGITDIQYLVVGGGGAGKNYWISGVGIPADGGVGGAGGGVQQGSATLVAGSTLSITVGAGGLSSAGNGSSSSIAAGGSSIVTASGGSGGSSVSGAGTSSSITGSAVTYGRDGGYRNVAPAGTNRGNGSGGGNYSDLNGNGYADSGDFHFAAPNGGSGVVYIRFAAAVAPSATPGAPSGTAEVGSSLTSGTVIGGVPTPTMTYQWESCTDPLDPSTCSAISGATSASYTPGASDAGMYLRVVTTATNSSGSITDTSPMSAQIGMPATAAPALDAASDTGTSSGDGETNDATPTVTVSGLVAGSLFTITASNGGISQTCSFTASGPTGGCTLPDLGDGTWSIEATQALNGVTSTPSPASSFSLDTSAPTAPGSPSSTTTGGTPIASHVSAYTTSLTIASPITAGEATGGKARFYLDGVLIGEDTSIGAGDTSVDLTFASSAAIQAAIADGGDLTVELVDAAGNATTGSPTPLVVDYIVPTVISFAPSAGQDPNTASMPMTFELNFSEAISGLTAADFSNAGTATGCVFTPDASSGTTFTVTVTGCAAGSVQPQLNAGAITDGTNPAPASASASGSPVNYVTSSPANTGAPSLSATSGTMTTLGSTLSSGAGSWNDQGDTSALTSYRWQVCSTSSPASCVDIPGATSSTFIPDGSLAGMYLRSVVTRENAAGTTEEPSALTGPFTKSPQSVTFADPADRAYTPTPFSVAPTASSGLAVTVSSTDTSVCIVNAYDVTLLKAGTCTLVATQPGDAVYDAATDVIQSLVISKATDSGSSTSASSANPAPGDSFTLSTTSGSSATPTYSVVSGPCTISGSTVTTTGAGDCVIGTSVPADDRYDSSTPTDITVPVRIPDSITFATIPAQLTSSPGVAPVVNATSGRTATVAAGPAGVCSMSGGLVVPVGPGTCTVTAALADDGTNAAANQTTSFTMVAPPVAATVNSVKTGAADGVIGGSAEVYFTAGALNGSTLIDYTVTATPSGGGTPVTVACLASPCTIDGLGDGLYNFTVTTNADALGNPASTSSATSTATVLAFHSISLQDPGVQRTGTAPFEIEVASDVNPTWTPTLTSTTPGVCAVAGTTVSVLGVGTCALVAEHSGGSSGGTSYGLGRAEVSFTVYTPVPIPAGQPGSVSATPGAGSVTVSWLPPVSAGSFVITHYRVMSSTGEVCLTTTLSCTFDDLPVGGPYSFQVSALTGAGWGPWSAAVSTEVTVPGDSSGPDSGDGDGTDDGSGPGDGNGNDNGSGNDNDTGNDNGTGNDGGSDGQQIRLPRPVSDIAIDSDTSGSGATLTITVPQSAKRPVTSVIVVIRDADGTIIKRVKVPVRDGATQVTVRIALPYGATYEAYAVNSMGVSSSAHDGANLVKGATGKIKGEKTKMVGKRIADVIYFDGDSVTLDARDHRVLKGVARFVAMQGGRLYISGYARKAPGPAAVALKLSTQRAKAVASYLSVLGVDVWIHFEGHGNYSETTSSATDRRVEIRWKG